MEIALGQDRARGIRDGISRGRESGTKDAFGEGRSNCLVELPDAAWHETNCRDPSTQTHLPFGRSVFGRDDKGVNVVNIGKITVDIM
jgi:hypothetical protein